MPSTDRGAGPSWLHSGDDPDYRFSLANERTFLAWIRTALAVLAGAVAISQVVPPFDVPAAGKIIAVCLALTGLAVAATAYPRWAANERAMRRHNPLPHTRMLLILAGAVLAVAAAILLLVALGGR